MNGGDYDFYYMIGFFFYDIVYDYYVVDEYGSIYKEGYDYINYGSNFVC